MLSSDSRWASVRGRVSVAGTGCTTPAAGSSSTSAVEATSSSVRPLYSATVPVRRTASPMATLPAVAAENTNTASDAVCVARSTAPPVPAVWIV